MPSFFSSIVGHQQHLGQLSTMLSRGTLPHALLLSGPQSVGKRSIAMALARFVFHFGLDEPVTQSATSQFATMENLQQQPLPDLQQLSLQDGKKEISIEVVREMCARLRLKPFHGKANVAIIDEAHLMSIAASNALLMTLEEPNRQSLLILVSSAAHRLPATIRSRCQVIHFSKLAPEELAICLRNIAGKEVDEELLQRVLSFCDGSLERLGLEFDAETGAPKVKNIQAHFEEFVAEQDAVRAAIRKVVQGKLRNSVAQATMLGSEYGATRETQKHYWEVLFSQLSGQLRAAPLAVTSDWAELLWESVTAEQQVRERYANAQLHWTSILTKVASRAL